MNFSTISDVNKFGVTSKRNYSVQRNDNYWRCKFSEVLLPCLCPKGMDQRWPFVILPGKSFFKLFIAFWPFFESELTTWWVELPTPEYPSGNMYALYLQANSLRVDKVLPHQLSTLEFSITHRSDIGGFVTENLSPSYSLIPPYSPSFRFCC